jgi:hypothetical protein
MSGIGVYMQLRWYPSSFVDQINLGHIYVKGHTTLYTATESQSFLRIRL